MSAQRPVARRQDAAEPEWLTLGQAAAFLGIAQSTIRKWADEGHVPAIRTPGGHRRFRLADLEAFIESSRAGGGRRDGPLVLVVDDDAQLRRLLRAILEQAGYTVGEAGSGEEGLAAIDEKPPALVLLDVVMPGADGWPFLRRLGERHGSTPLIMFSGQADDPEELLARARQLVPV